MDNRGKLDNKRYNCFQRERGTILEDIKKFLMMILTYFVDMEERFGRDSVVNGHQVSVKSLIKSLCQIHALYCFPAETGQGGQLEFNASIEDFLYRIGENANDSKKVRKLANSARKRFKKKVIDKNAVKSVLLGKIESKNEQNATVKFADYCNEVKEDRFWQSIFNEFENKNYLLREPAHIFLQMVGEMFGNDYEEACIVGREVLETLPDDNYLKPAVWAQHKTEKKRYGVSLGVRSFVRPFYLYIKLNELRNKESVCNLNDVTAMPIRYKNKKDPCTSCQRIFNGGLSCAPLGNCAEYDVIGNVNFDLLGTKWEQFESVYERHFVAFTKMLEEIRAERSRSNEEIIKKYFISTRNPKPNVLQYEWNSERNVFELIVRDC